jgi:hypothetical protein
MKHLPLMFFVTGVALQAMGIFMPRENLLFAFCLFAVGCAFVYFAMNLKEKS